MGPIQYNAAITITGAIRGTAREKLYEKLDLESLHKRNILKFIRPSSNFALICHSPKGIKLITRLRFCFSHLREHKLPYSFQDTLNPIFSCGDDIKTTIYYLLHCPNYLHERRTLFDNLQSTEENIHNKNDSQISELRLFDVSSNNDATNTCILNATIQYILAAKRFDSPLNNSCVIRNTHIFQYIS